MKLSDKLKTGDIISLTHYSKVKEARGTTVVVETQDGQSITYQGIVDSDTVLSADHWETEEKITKTQMEEIFKTSSRVPLTVSYYKQVKKEDVAAQIADLYPNKGTIMSLADFTKEAKKIASSVITGELRIARGYHFSTYGVGGRINFIDMDKVNDPTKDYDTRLILVDPRTIFELIVNGVKYAVK